MSTGHILLLGAIAGATIFLGMPIGRMQLGPPRAPALSALATGILLFLLWDVLTGAVEPITAALDARHWGRFSWLAALGVAGFALGLMALVYYSEWMKARAGRRASAARRPGRRCARRVRAPRAWLDSLTPGEAARAPDRGRDRRAQLRRGPRDRPGRGREQDQPRGHADHRLRAAQRDRGLRHLRPDGGRGDEAELGLPRACSG